MGKMTVGKPRIPSRIWDYAIVEKNFPQVDIVGFAALMPDMDESYDGTWILYIYDKIW